MIRLRGDYNFVARRRSLQLDEVVIGAVGGHQAARMLEVLELGLALKRAVAGLVEPCAEAGELVDKQIVYNWKGVGWVAGTITKAVKDGRVKNNGEQVNFVAFYSDETEGKHCLKLEAYGELDVRVHDQWVLLAQCD